MSQAKVDKYKQDKANRKKIIAKQKRTLALQKFAFAVVSLALVAFIVVSAYFKWFKDDKSDTENVTYALSEEEISSVWSEASEKKEEESTSSDTTDNKETSADNNTEDESTEETTSAS